MQTSKQLARMSRQAITTRFVGPTNSKGSRIIAKCEARMMIVPYDDALDIDENHAAAALKLFRAMGWDQYNDLAMGGTRDGYVFVQVTKGNK